MIGGAQLSVRNREVGKPSLLFGITDNYFLDEFGNSVSIAAA
jgi:hypothetical protein